MDDRGANIDIVFRNGLKDYEVLPPQDAWDKIQPVVRKQLRPLTILRAAAMFAVLISLGILVYQFSREIPQGLESPVLAMNPESYAPPSHLTTPVSPVNEISRNGSFYNIASSDDQAIRPVTTDNIAPAVRNFEGTAESNELKGNTINRSEFTSVDYLTTGYVNLNEDYSLVPDNTTRKEPNRWSISALVSPTYQARFISGENESVSQLLESEQAVLSYSGGLALSYKISGRFSIQSGIFYSEIGKELAGITAYSGFKDYFYSKGSSDFTVLTSNGPIYTSNNDIFLTDGLSAERIQTSYNNNVFDPEKASLNYLDNSLHQNFGFLELPVVLRYKVVDRALDFNIIGGISSNLMINNSVYAASDGKRTRVGTTDVLNLLTFSSSLGMGMEYNFSNNLSLNLEPTFRYYINPSNEIPGMKIHPYSFGIFSGISYKF